MGRLLAVDRLCLGIPQGEVSMLYATQDILSKANYLKAICDHDKSLALPVSQLCDQFSKQSVPLATSA